MRWYVRTCLHLLYVSRKLARSNPLTRSNTPVTTTLSPCSTPPLTETMSPTSSYDHSTSHNHTLPLFYSHSHSPFLLTVTLSLLHLQSHTPSSLFINTLSLISHSLSQSHCPSTLFIFSTHHHTLPLLYLSSLFIFSIYIFPLPFLHLSSLFSLGCDGWCRYMQREE